MASDVSLMRLKLMMEYEVRRWITRSYGVMVSTLDFESSDPGSNPGRSLFLRATCVWWRLCVSLACDAQALLINTLGVLR